MNVIALGINHTTASLDIREKVAFASAHIADALNHAMRTCGLREIAILSTCNRTEIYAHGECSAETLLEWLAQYKHIELDPLRGVHYIHIGKEAALHMMKVAAGLDSQVLGEPQILGQMKTAYSMAEDAQALNGHLRHVFQRVFSVAKKVRTETSIGENPVSVAFAAVSLAQQIFADLRKGTALLIGAGETIELVAKHIEAQGIGKLIVANRTLDNAAKLSEQYNAQAIVLADIPKHLPAVDIVISSTASQLPVLGKGAVEQALKARKHKPFFMVDIAVPRDIEPQVNDLDDVYLYTVDDLQDVIDSNMQSRQQAAEMAVEIIEQGVVQFEQELRALDSVSTIKALREQAERVRQQEVVRALKSLQAGAAPEAAIEQLARGLTNKLLHEPSRQLKEAASQGSSHIIHSAQLLFGVEPAGKSASHKNEQAKHTSEKQ